jgi:hypothetical protein
LPRAPKPANGKSGSCGRRRTLRPAPAGQPFAVPQGVLPASKSSRWSSQRSLAHSPLRSSAHLPRYASRCRIFLAHRPLASGNRGKSGRGFLGFAGSLELTTALPPIYRSRWCHDTRRPRTYGCLLGQSQAFSADVSIRVYSIPPYR